MGTITTILYVIVGIGIFALAFLMIEKKKYEYMGRSRWRSRISPR
ncbi:MAG: hypothetical protein ACLTFJ_12845 [Clostridium sp.]